MINEFRGEYAYLSNFYSCNIEYEGIIYPSSENLFQAFKTMDIDEKIKISKMTPKDAKTYGRKIPIDLANWHINRLKYMYVAVSEKFIQNPELRNKLNNTNDEEIIEGNIWNDTYWGVCNGKGKNMLGKILMAIRNDIKTYYRSIEVNYSNIVIEGIY